MRALAQHIISMAICKINYPKRGIIMTDKFVTLAHGAGGKQTSELIDRVFKEHFANPDLTADDAAVLSIYSLSDCCLDIRSCLPKA